MGYYTRPVVLDAYLVSIYRPHDNHACRDVYYPIREDGILYHLQSVWSGREANENR